MNFLRWLTETGDERRARQSAERRTKRQATVDSYKKTYDHPDDWGPGYGATLKWTNSKRKDRH